MQTCRRQQPRYTLGGPNPTWLEFRFPDAEGGRDFRFAIADISASGLGFVLEESLPLDLGTTLRGATLCHGERRIGMDLLVLHVTQEFAAEAVCGCLVYPASDADLVAFKDFLSALASDPATAQRTKTPATS